MNRNQRRQAHSIKRGEDVACLGRIASGNHLVAQNDEPELLFEAGTATPEERNLAAAWTGLSEEDLQLGDVQRSVDKARRFHERNDRQALDLQVALDQRRRQQ